MSPVSNIVDDPTQADYSTDEGEFECIRAVVPITDQALHTEKVPAKKNNTAKRRTAVPRDRVSGTDYNLNYFNL